MICNLGGIRELCGEHQDSTVRLSISCSLLLKPKQTSEPAQYKDPSQEDWRKLVCYCHQKPWLYNHIPYLSQYQSMSWLHTMLKLILMIMIPKFPLFPCYPMNFTMNFSINVHSFSNNGISTQGTNLVLGPPEKFYRRNPSGTFRDVHWYHLGDPKKVPGAPSQGFLIFLGFDKNIIKIEIWL